VKLLFDENLSHRLVSLLADLFPDSVHVRDIGLKSADDLRVWDYAKTNNFIIVSKDSDMHDRSFLYGYPPKVVWIRLGNCSTSDVEKLLRREYETVETFYKDNYASFLTLS
jgi:predicted nuclease of predicted toxin-antitoxin system